MHISILRTLLKKRRVFIEYLGNKHSDDIIKQIAETVDFRNSSKKKYDIIEGFGIDKNNLCIEKVIIVKKFIPLTNN